MLFLGSADVKYGLAGDGGRTLTCLQGVTQMLHLYNYYISSCLTSRGVKTCITLYTKFHVITSYKHGDSACHRKHVTNLKYSGHEVVTFIVNPLQPVATVRTARFNIQQFYVLPTQCVYVFCVDLGTNSDYFPIQH
jgi:hypothetical protein